MASLDLMFLNFFIGKFKKGPPDAVIKILSIAIFFEFFINDQMEKCSESIGINFVLFFLILFQLNSTHIQ